MNYTLTHIVNEIAMIKFRIEKKKIFVLAKSDYPSKC